MKCDVSNKFPYQFLEKIKQNKNKFESKYETKLQIAGTKHTTTTDTNKVIRRKLVSKPLPNSFQNPLSRRGGNRRGPDGKFAIHTSRLIEEDTEEEELEEIEETEEQEPSTLNTSIDTLDDSFDFAGPIQNWERKVKTIPKQQ